MGVWGTVPARSSGSFLLFCWLVASSDPGLHDLGGQPVPADLGLGDDGHAVGGAQRVGASGEEECGDVGVQRPAGLDVAVVLDIDRVAEQGPPTAVVAFN